MSEPRTAIEWLEDFQECVEGDHGPEWQERADEWMEAHVDTLPTDGTSWKAWREFRQANLAHNARRGDQMSANERPDSAEKDARMQALVAEAAAALGDVYEPAGVLIFWSARIKYLDGKRPCDIYSEGDLDLMERLVQRVTALADGAFA